MKKGWQVVEIAGSVCCSREEIDYAFSELTSPDAPSAKYTIRFVNSGRKAKVGKGQQNSRHALGTTKFAKGESEPRKTRRRSSMGAL